MSNSDPGFCLRNATALKSSGDINAAIASLEEFERAVAASSICYPVANFLRRPAYLQEAGRRDEAWHQFCHLLKYGYPNQLRDAGVMRYEASIIYDKMRLFLQRDDNDSLAAHFWVLSKAAKVSALKMQKRKQEFRSESSLEKFREEVREMIDETPQAQSEDKIVDAFKTFVESGCDMAVIERASEAIFTN